MATSDSPLVYVVPLNRKSISVSGMSTISLLENHRRYFHPSEQPGYPSEPADYLGFRYDGRLQSIHRVLNTQVVDDLREELRDLTGDEFLRSVLGYGPYFLFRLGPTLGPDREIRSGPIWNTRSYVYLDLLLDCATIETAMEATKKRKDA